MSSIDQAAIRSRQFMASKRSLSTFIPATHALKIARSILLVQMAFMYGGGVPYLDYLIGHWPLYTYYFIMIACSCWCWIEDRRTYLVFAALIPYILWYVGFSLWLISNDVLLGLPMEGTWMVVRDMVRAFIVWPALAAMLPNRNLLRRFACLVTVAVAINVVISWLTPNTPWLFALIIKSNNLESAEHYGQIARSVGIWGNANQAAYAFLYAALLSLWVPGFWSCLTWISALTGTIMTASRQGTYLLTLSAIVYMAHLARKSFWTREFRFLKKGLIIAVLVGGLLIGYYTITARNSPISHNLPRFFAMDEDRQLREGTMSSALGKIWSLSPLFGNGSYTFRNLLISYGPHKVDQGTHNIYLAIWGEAGLFMLVAYLLVMGWGVERIIKARVAISERVPLLLMWVCYMSIGMTSHQQMGDFNLNIIVALLFALPVILAQPREPNSFSVGGPNRERPQHIQGYPAHKGISRS
jgi:hypothetical protein